MDKLCLVLLLVCLAGCHSHDAHETHEEEEPEATQVTLWNQDVELFIEYPAFVAGEPIRFVTHVTHLDRWAPRVEGEILVILSKEGEAPIEIHDQAPVRDGIYIPTLTFPVAGTWDIEVRVPLANSVSSQVIAGVTVYASAHDATHASPAEEADGGISFLKEQQWVMPFASEEVAERPFRQSLAANGVIGPRAGGEVVVHAPVGGRLLASSSAAPHIGALVVKGEQMGSILPRLDQAQDPAVLTLAVQRAQLAHDFARSEWERITALFQKEAVPKNRVQVAELEVGKTRAELTSAKERLKQFSSVQRETEDDASARVDVYSPLSGTIIEANVVPGAFLPEGERMFRLIDLTKIWLTVHIPENDIGRIVNAQGAWFTVDGLEPVFEVDPENGGRLVTFGGEIDPIRRTVPLVFELPNLQGLLKIGMFARVSVLTGQTAMGPSVPTSALIDEDGQTVAYVHVGGESFERRVLRLGLRDGHRVQVVTGIEVGERVVTEGAYQIRLAAASTTVPAHGHAH